VGQRLNCCCVQFEIGCDMFFQRDCGDGWQKGAIETGIWTLLAVSGRRESTLLVKSAGEAGWWWCEAGMARQLSVIRSSRQTPDTLLTPPPTSYFTVPLIAQTRTRSQTRRVRFLTFPCLLTVAIEGPAIVRVFGVVEASSGQAVARNVASETRYRPDIDQQRTRRGQLDQ